MTKIKEQLAKLDSYDELMSRNIQRVSAVTGRMKSNASRCKISSIMIWRDKAETILPKLAHGK